MFPTIRMTEALVDVSIYPELEYISHSFGGLKECENRSVKFGNTVARVGKYRRKSPANFAGWGRLEIQEERDPRACIC